MADDSSFPTVAWRYLLPSPPADKLAPGGQLGGGYGSELEATGRGLHDPATEHGRPVALARQRYAAALDLTEEDGLVLPKLAWIYRAHRNFVRGSKADAFCRL